MSHVGPRRRRRRRRKTGRGGGRGGGEKEEGEEPCCFDSHLFSVPSISIIKLSKVSCSATLTPCRQPPLP